MSAPTGIRPGTGTHAATGNRAATRILVADDHLVFRMGLRALLAAEPGFDVVGEARNGAECVDLFTTLAPDVVLMDLRMPGDNGLTALRRIRALDSAARVLILTSFCAEEEIYQALHLGALGYVLKDIGRTELTDAIRAVAANRRCIPPAVALRLAERLPRPALTTRETEIMQLLVKGLMNREIAHILGVSVSTIKNQLNTLFVKLEVTDRTEAATTALQRGIVHMEP